MDDRVLKFITKLGFIEDNNYIGFKYELVEKNIRYLIFFENATKYDKSYYVLNYICDDNDTSGTIINGSNVDFFLSNMNSIFKDKIRKMKITSLING